MLDVKLNSDTMQADERMSGERFKEQGMREKFKKTSECKE
jgi:hypothetical protein